MHDVFTALCVVKVWLEPHGEKLPRPPKDVLGVPLDFLTQGVVDISGTLETSWSQMALDNMLGPKGPELIILST